MSALSIKSLEHIVFNEFLQNDDYSIFIESGTCSGFTILTVQPYFETLYTIEISEKYFNEFDQKKKTLGIDNITNLLGDSGKVIGEILNKIDSDKNCIFWLDGHWSSGDTGRGDKDCPLIEECVLIDNLYKSKRGIILIDDYSMFGTYINEDWSEITDENVLNCFKNYRVTNKIIYNNIFCLLIER